MVCGRDRSGEEEDGGDGADVADGDKVDGDGSDGGGKATDWEDWINLLTI